MPKKSITTAPKTPRQEKKEIILKKDVSFNTLPISTQTVMAYMNCKFDINNIFNKLPVDNSFDNLKNIKGENGKIYQLKRAGQIRGVPSKKDISKNFRNQITAYIFIIDKIITAKIFPTGKFHLTGCKTLKHQQYASIELLNHIRQCHTNEEPTIEITDNQPLNVILEVVMVNIDFHLGFDVDQRKLDRLLQSEDCEFYTIYETPVNTSVNIKLDYPEPKQKKFNQIIIEGSVNNPDITFTTTDKCLQARDTLTRTHTFLVFSSSKVIQSGRFYDSEMEPAYKKFHNFILKHRDEIELKPQEKTFDLSQLKSMQKPIQLNLNKI
jgi:TATA-box binding protein (TBP) (component of TFIID and TFIIIB)